MNFNPKNIKLIIGIGNPGEEYKNTYHNAGKAAVEHLIKKEVSDPDLAISECYMNQSGFCVKKFAKNRKIKTENILIVHDDADIELGKFKISFGRGSAGHKGIESIIKALGTKNFWRIRIGIRKPKNLTKAGGLVLNKIKKTDKKTLEKVFEEINQIFQD